MFIVITKGQFGVKELIIILTIEERFKFILICFGFKFVILKCLTFVTFSL